MLFSDFIDKVANKLQCLAVFNALFIYSLSLERNLAGKSLMVCFMILSLMLLNTIIRDAIKNYESGSLGYVAFIGCLIVAALALTLYSVVKYPEFLFTVLFLLMLVFFAIMLFLVSTGLETTAFGKRAKIFTTDTPANDFIVVVVSLLLSYYTVSTTFETVMGYVKMIPINS